MKDEATTAKDAGIVVATIAFRLQGVRCKSGGEFVTSVLASMASPVNGVPSVDDGGPNGSGGTDGPGCNTAARIAGENADGDYFFCTPTPSQLTSVFKAATSQISGGIRLLRLP